MIKYLELNNKDKNNFKTLLTTKKDLNLKII